MVEAIDVGKCHSGGGTFPNVQMKYTTGFQRFIEEKVMIEA